MRKSSSSVKVFLDSVESEVAVCTKCSLHKTRKNAVPGEGSSKAKIMFIGEAPGHLEDLKGRPFVGDAGRFLETLLSILGLSRNSVFICNVVKCRPPGNRAPRPFEIQKCTSYLDRQIEALKPRLIITLGSCSTACLFSKANLPFGRITQAHGKFYKTRISGVEVIVFPTFHPAAALYNPKYKELLQQDFQLLRSEIEKGAVV